MISNTSLRLSKLARTLGMLSALALAACGTGDSSVFTELDPGDESVVVPPPPGGASRPSQVTLGAYYYTWWNGPEWDKGVIGEPRVGRYDSGDPTAAGFHITDATQAGIDVFAVNWFAGDSDRALREGLLRAPNLDQMKFCIHYDTAIRFDLASLSFDLSRPIPRVAFISDMRYIAQNYMNHPQYYRVNGRPVVIIYLSRVITGDLEGVIDLARSELADLGFDVYFVGDEIEDGDRDPDPARVRLFDGITAYNLYNPFLVEAGLDTLPEWTEYSRGVYEEWGNLAARTRVKGRGINVDFQPGVIPQYNDTQVRGGNLPITSSSPREFSDMLDMAQDSSGPGGVIWITSWNEWHEGTTIEPSTQGQGIVSDGQYSFGFLEAVTASVPDPEPAVRFERMAIVGLGLIGGSLALAARARGLVGQVVGIGRGRANLEVGLERGVVDEITHDVAEGVTGADLVVLAVPVATMGEVARRMAPALAPGTIVTDVGSVKQTVASDVAAGLGGRGHFVPGHPIAGTERSGVAHAFPELFEGRRCILTPDEGTDRGALERVRALWEGVGSAVSEMDPGQHDRVLAMVSHLPHLVAFALVLAVDAREREGEECLSFSAGGLADFTRIAGSDPVMWRDIFLDNADAVLAALDGYRAELDRIAGWIRAEQGAELVDALARGREVRMRLDELRGAKRDER